MSDEPFRFDPPVVPFGLFDDSVKASVMMQLDPPRCGRRYTVHVDVADNVPTQAAQEIVWQAMRQAADRLFFEQHDNIYKAAERLLLDLKWVQPIVEDELRKAVRRLFPANADGS